jgi:hypothetical protein
MYLIENKATNIFQHRLNMDNELRKDNHNKTRNGLDFMYGFLGPCHFSVQLLEHVNMDLELEITYVFLEMRLKVLRIFLLLLLLLLIQG